MARANNISDDVSNVLYLVPEDGVVVDDYVKNGDYIFEWISLLRIFHH